MRYTMCLMAAILSACATVPPEQQAAMQRQFEATMPRCATDKECEAKWAAARRWVLDNSGFKLQHYTDSYMETFNNAYDAETSTWARVTKEPISETEYVIRVELGCNNWFGCSLSPLAEYRLRFNNYVNASWGPAPPSPPP